jgi:prolyl-tRNA synthetase
MLEVYRVFAEEYMAMPVHTGVKTASERFAGAVDTYCIEAMMQDGKALQAGTSHFLGQNFAKAFDVKFQDNQSQLDYVWATSWGVSTRLIGGLIMTHSDDDGLVLPPRLAPTQVVIVPIWKNDEEKALVSEYAMGILNQLKLAGIRVKFDDREQYKPGWKFAQYEVEGVPLRIAVGPRDAQNGMTEVARRDTRSKELIARDELLQTVTTLLDVIQTTLFETAKARRDALTSVADTYDEFKRILDETGGFIYAHWDGTPETEAKIKEETKATIRCVPFNNPHSDAGTCMISGKPSQQRVLFARSY